MTNKIVLPIALSVCLLCACARSYQEEDLSSASTQATEQAEKEKLSQEEKLMEANKVMLKKEQERIASYISRRGWDMEQKEGVYVQELTARNGKAFVQDDKVKVEYDCELLTGEKIFSSKTDGAIVFTIGKGGNMPLGLQTAVEAMSDGTRARVIVPYNMAYGLSGDGNKVPKSASLVYVLTVSKLN